MAWTYVNTDDTIEADHLNDIMKALDGTAGKAQPIELTELDDPGNYALKLRNKDATQGRQLLVQDSNGDTLLEVLDSGIEMGTNLAFSSTETVDGVDVSTHQHTGESGHGPQIPTAGIANGAVTNAKLGADCVDGTKIADDAIDSEHYAAASIDTEHIADLQVTEGKLAAGAVTETKIGTGAVTEDKIGTGAVTNAKLGADCVDGTKIADDAIDSEHYAAASIDTEHIADNAVDDTKVGSRVVQCYRRQGGDSPDWHTPGTTTYTPTAVRMQVGSIEWTGSAADHGEKLVSFPVWFSGKPLVFLTVRGTDINQRDITCMAGSHAVNQFNLLWEDTGGDTWESLTFHWLAIGPE